MALQIGALSRATGVHIETIRYYEKTGLMPSPPRSEGGRRQFSDEHVIRLTFVKRCRELGFTLGEIRALLGLVDGGYTCGEVRDITLRHQKEISEKIADLRRLDRTLRDLADNCKGGDAPDCPVIDALFAVNGRPGL